MPNLTKEALLIQNALLTHGLENPIVTNTIDNQTQKKDIAKNIESIITLLNLDLHHNSLLDTPQRIAKMYIEEIFSGLNYLNFPKITIIKNTIQTNDDTITTRNINFTSICEHHFMVFSGKVTISYIPKKNIIGLSNINKIIQFFSKRPQIQERLTQQISLALQTLLNTNNIAVCIDAIHYCIKARNMQDITSTTTTTAFKGLFKSNKNIKKEFLHAIIYCCNH